MPPATGPEDTIDAPWVRGLGIAHGFAGVGLCRLGPTAHGAAFDRWLAEGRHGEMAWLAEHREVRCDPRRLIIDDATGGAVASSAVMVSDLYRTRANATDGPLPPGHGRIARYARGRDYHEVMRRRLHAMADAMRARWPAHRFRAFVDTAPVMERELAMRAGLGWVGKHTLLIHPRDGSWFFLAGIATTLGLAAGDEPAEVGDRCAGCTRCIDACPTGAITPYAVDARRCVSYLTIERRSPEPDPELGAGVGSWLFGCDVCQEVCPYNSPRDAAWVASGGASSNPAYEPRRDSLDIREVMAWTEEDRRRELSGTAMKRAKLAMWHRNAAVVAGNAGEG